MSIGATLDFRDLFLSQLFHNSILYSVPLVAVISYKHILFITQYSRQISVKELDERAPSMSCFILLLRRVSAELASKNISFTYVTDRKVKDIGENLYRPP